FQSPATSVFYTLSLHDALPICNKRRINTCNFVPCKLRSVTYEEISLIHVPKSKVSVRMVGVHCVVERASINCLAIELSCERSSRSEEHTSELQSRGHLVCRLLL